MNLQGAKAQLFLWTDLSEEDLQAVWTAGLETPTSAAVLQRASADLGSKTDLQAAIELDLYRQALRQGKVYSVMHTACTAGCGL